ncbi:N-acylneuraminate cytidylyltransferase [Nocardiopsis terrae]|uniref:N-acylneuraminate cytidylyltransferase n=1 Tax=Nocardiopsis terrae TaxID=372655 RepID=A0ABR9HM93_9ACTN|nr:acylneuraminate cytidylyltransferase [Nocardiopsis terrae]MBE1460126.1 N-acylneuraminate cytidylyltransferase [Nocardiopsis terrae]
MIPARGGSKGIPLKNVAPVGGVPLVTRAIRASEAAQTVTETVVSTDHGAIARAAADAGARVLERPADLGGDTVSSEAVLLQVVDALEQADGSAPDVLVFVQCTSPFISPDDLDSAVRRILDSSADSVFAAVETHAFLWRATPAGARGVNHGHTHRHRRQDREPQFQETGAFYAMRTEGLRTHRHRFFGRIAVQEVSPLHGFEVDAPDDLHVVRALAAVADPERFPIDVDAVVTDFDGVHTDDRATVSENGAESVTVSRSDGMGVKLLREAGVRLLVLSTEENPVVCARADKLKVPVLHGLSDKRAALATWLDEEDLDPARVAYVGNDVNDLGCLSLVGWPVAVPDSHPDVLAAARVVLTRRGGDGAVRELCERVLKTREGTR